MIALATVLGGVFLIARFALYMASPAITRYAGDLASREGADYSFWAFGPLIPPINPEAIQAAEAEENIPPGPADPGPEDNVPIAVVSAPTQTPTLAAVEPPSATPTPTATETQAPQQAAPPPPPPSATPTRTSAPLLAPTLAPTSTRQPTSTPAAPSSTPVSAPDTPPSATPAPPTATRTSAPPPPTATRTPVPPAGTPTSTPSPAPPTSTPTNTPTPTPAPPVVSFGTTALSVAESALTLTVEVRLNKAAPQPVTVSYGTQAGTAQAGADFTLVSGTVTIIAGSDSATFSVPIIRDALDETPERFTITLSSPTNATLDTTATATVTITDSNAAPRASFSGSARTVGEAAGSAAVTIQLSEPSALDVTVPYVLQRQSTAALDDHGLRDGTVIIQAGQTSARVRFSIAGDDVDEDNETLGVYLGTPTNAELAAPSAYLITIADDDTAGVRVAPTGFNLTEDAGASQSATYEVVLESQPVSPVTISLLPDAQVQVSPAQLVFTAANWWKPQRITLTAVDDFVDEDGTGNTTPHAGGVAHAAASADPRYNGIAVAQVAAQIQDNDTAGVLVSTTALALTESPAGGGNARSYSVRLASQPVADVTISLAPNSQVNVTPATLTFTAADWNIAQIVTVTAVDDAVDEGATNNPGTVAHAATSADRLYSGIAIPAVTATITDDDVAGVTVAPTALTVTEGNPPAPATPTSPGNAVTYSVRLNSEPTANVTLSLSAGPPGLVTVSPATLTFDATNWSTPRTVTVTTVANFVDAPDATATVSHGAASGDPFYNGFDVDEVLVTVVDDDTAGITLSKTALAITESRATGAYSDTYTIRLTSQPTANVTVALSAIPAAPNAQVTVSPTGLTFTPTNWAAPRTVTVTSINDAVDEGATNNPGGVAHTVTSADPNYGGFAIPNVPATITDDDVARVNIKSTTLTVPEGNPPAIGNTTTYTITLNSQPTANVTVAIAESTAGLLAPIASPLTFTPANWNTAQTVTLATVPNFVDAPDATAVVAHTAGSGDPFYSGIPVDPVTVTIADDDTAGVTVTPTALSIAEGGATGSYAVRLTSQPTAPVTVTLSPDAELLTSAAELVFTAASWSTPQTVTVTAIDDAVDEDGDGNTTPHTGTVVHAATSADANYGGRSVASVTATITDNDTAGVIIAPTALTVAEGNPPSPGNAVTYGVRLVSRPTRPVTIGIAESTAGLLAPIASPLTFTPGNWSITQTVTLVTAPNFVDAPDAVASVAHTVTSADPFYGSLSVGPVSVTITDDDAAGVSVTPTALSVAEGGATGSYAVRLDSQPTAPVTVTLSPDAELLASAAELVFTPADWSVAQTVTVTAADDSIDEDGDGNTTPHAGTISHAAASADPTYGGIAVADVGATIADNDTVGATITSITLTVAEGDPPGPGNAVTYAVRLNSQPTSPVTITVDAAPAGLIAPFAPLVFTPADWNIAQTVTATTVPNFVDAPDATAVVGHTISSADSFYGGLSVADVSITVTNDDAAGVVVAPTALALAEGGAPGAYSVRLSSEPTSPVTVTLSPNAQLSVSPAELVFTAADWDIAQSVAVTATDDLVDEGASDNPGAVAHAAASADPTYGGITVAGVSATIADNDAAGIALAPAALTVAEGDPPGPGNAVTYDVRLDAEPTGPVTIAVDAAPAGLLAPVAPLVFTPADWNIAQTVTLVTVPNFVEAPDALATVSHTATSGDPLYDGVAAGPVSVTITNDDTAGFLVSRTALALSEDPAAADHSDSYTVRLGSQPRAPVTIMLAPDAQLELSAATLTFTAADWNIAQTVVVSATDDLVDEAAPHAGLIAHTAASGDPRYDDLAGGLVMPDVTATIADNDTAGITVAPTALTVAEGGTITYTLRLDSEPTAPVTVTADVGPAGPLAPVAAPLVFTPADWSTPQVVTVTAPANFVDAPDAAAVISHTAASADPGYAGIGVAAVAVAVADDDTAAVLAGPGAVAVEELVTAPGHSATYTVRLGSEPTGAVTVTLGLDAAQLEASPTTLVFTPATWGVSQTVTVTATDDIALEGPHTSPISHTAGGDDPAYAALPALDVTAAITDDDQAALEVAPASLSLSESITGTFPISGLLELRLRSAPTDAVTVTLTPDAQLTASAPEVVFTPLDWSTPQTVTLTAVDDAVDEASPHAGALALSLSSPDPLYDGRAAPAVAAAIEDDDSAALLVSAPSAATTSEAGGVITFTVRLASKPLAAVTVTPEVDNGEASVSAPALPISFDASNWDQPVEVTLAGLDDGAFDGRAPFAVTFQLAGDAAYAALPAGALPSLSLANDDDEPALVSVGDPAPLSEGDTGMRSLRFPLSLARPATVPVTVSYETFDLTATGGDDFIAGSGTLVIPAGQLTASVGVLLIGDAAYEPDEQVGLRVLAATAAGDVTGVDDGQGVGVIRNDDDPAVSFAAAGASAAESGGAVTITVRLNGPLTTTLQVGYTTVDLGPGAGTATDAVDYVAVAGTLTFAPGETEQTIVLTILDDDSAAEDPSETVVLRLTSADAATIGAPDSATVTILDD